MNIEAQSRVPVRNLSGLDDTVILNHPEVASLQNQLVQWVEKARLAPRQNLFDRGTYSPPNNPYDEMRAARHAVQYDDIVSGVAEVTEGFAFQGVKWEAEDLDDADIFNQMSADLNLDRIVRQIWREEYTQNVCYVAMVWGRKEYTVRGRNPAPEEPLEKINDPLTGETRFEEPRDPKTFRPLKRKKGPKRKKKYEVYVPTQMRILDPMKIVPLGIGPLGQERYGWYATDGEIGLWQETLDGTKVDVGMSTFFLGKYTPTRDEEDALATLGIDANRLLLINPDNVFCHASTKPDYQRFPDIRLKSCFSLLDLKHQLLQADRAMLIGAANYILLVRKGTKEDPATQAEIDHLKTNYQFVAKLPVIISDHRLEIEIVAPKIDLTLQQEKYDVIDTRLLSRLLGTLSLGGRGQRNETNITLSFPVARALENRRHMLRRTLEHHIARAICQHPVNKAIFEDEPNLVYAPRQVSLGFDQPLLQAMINLRTQKEISRETMLEFLGLDQATEAMRRENEADRYDDIFQTAVPFSSPLQGGPNGGPVAPGVAGGQGGRPFGGGAPKANPTKAPAKTAQGNTAPKKGPAR